MNAQVGGHFARHGLDCDIVGGANAPMAVQQTIVGRAQVMRGAGTDIATAVGNQGAPLIAICTVFQSSSFMVVSQKSKPVQTAQDFIGKVVGVPGRQSGAEQVIDILMSKDGLDPKQVRREAVGNGVGAWGLITSGRIDAAVLSISAVMQIRDVGEDPLAWNTETVWQVPGQINAVNTDFAAKDPEFPVQYVRALRDSMAELRSGDHMALVKRIAAKYPVSGRENPDFLVRAMREEIGLWLASGEENLLRNVPDRWSAMTDAMAKAGIVKTLDPTTLYTNAYIDKM